MVRGLYLKQWLGGNRYGRRARIGRREYALTEQSKSIQIPAIIETNDDTTRMDSIVRSGTDTRDPERIILDTLPSMMAYWDRDLRCRFANKAYERWFGVLPASLIGKSLQDLLGPTLFAMNEPYVRGVLQGRDQIFERDVPGPDGVIRHSLAHYTPDVHEGQVVGFVVQVTEIKSLHDAQIAWRAEAAQRANAYALLRKSERALRQAQQLGRLGSWEWDIESDLIHCSDQLYEIFGLDPSTGPLVYAKLDSLYTPASWAKLNSAVQRALHTGDPYVLELEFLRPDGSTGWIEARGAAERDSSGRVVSLLGTVQDMSVRRQVDTLRSHEQSLAEALHELDSTRRRAAELQRALEQARKVEVLGILAGGIAHDFNNVLAAVSGSFHLLTRLVKDPRPQEFIQRGLRAVERATRLVRQLMNFARTQSVEARAVDLAAMITDCRELLQLSAGPRVNLTIEAAADCVAVVDANQLEVALLNLTINARDAMPDGGDLSIGVLDRVATQYLPGERKNSNYVAIRVHDSGAGMTPDVLARAREPFFTTKGSDKGTGLGLAMVNAFAQQAGGSLELESRPGQGTSAYIVLPSAQEKSLAPAHAAAQNIDRNLHGHATVIVVDDDPLVRPVIGLYLRDLGYEVFEAEGAREAQKIAASIPTLDLVVTDVTMPEMDGVELACALREVRPGLPILLMTGNADRRRLTGEAMLEKPFTQSDLASQVATLLGRGGKNADRIAGRIKHPAQRALYETWRHAKPDRDLPQVSDLQLDHCAAPEHVFVVEITRQEPFEFNRKQIGRALQARLDAAAHEIEDPFADREIFGGIDGAYARCARLKEPHYEQMRFRTEDGQQTYFERLLLPCTDGAERRPHLVGMVIIETH